MPGAEQIDSQSLLYAYAAGIFPMAESATSDQIMWIDPKFRGILPLDGFHISKSLAKLLRSNKYRVSVNQCFAAVIDACANRDETWINEEITSLYNELHASGAAHSIEVWQDDQLIGGAYGIAMNGVFFGESMFSLRPNASKVALVALVARLNAGGFQLLDTQFLTDHLASLGGIEIPREIYQCRLKIALNAKADFFRLHSSDTCSIWQLSTQTS